MSFVRRTRARVSYPALLNAPLIDPEVRYTDLRTIYSDAIRPAPIPSPTLAVRRSLFETRNRAHLQAHVDPSWGRSGHGGNRHERFSLLGLSMMAGKPPSRVPAEMQPTPRFTKVLRFPRRPSTPGVYEPLARR